MPSATRAEVSMNLAVRGVPSRAVISLPSITALWYFHYWAYKHDRSPVVATLQLLLTSASAILQPVLFLVHRQCRVTTSMSWFSCMVSVCSAGHWKRVSLIVLLLFTYQTRWRSFSGNVIIN